MAYDPVLRPNGIVQALEAHRGRVEQTRENTARFAQSYASFTTTGVGEVVVEEVSLFGCTFSEQPVVAYGSTLPVDAQNIPQPMVAGAFPRCSGGVRSWYKDDRGFFVGANIYLVVDVPDSVVSPPAWVVEHEFTFTAIAFKDLPAHLLIR